MIAYAAETGNQSLLETHHAELMRFAPDFIDSIIGSENGNADAISTAWILPSLLVSLLIEGERAWNAGLPPFLLLTWSAIPALWVRTRRGRSSGSNLSV